MRFNTYWNNQYIPVSYLSLLYVEILCTIPHLAIPPFRNLYLCADRTECILLIRKQCSWMQTSLSISFLCFGVAHKHLNIAVYTLDTLANTQLVAMYIRQFQIQRDSSRHPQGKIIFITVNIKKCIQLINNYDSVNCSCTIDIPFLVPLACSLGISSGNSLFVEELCFSEGAFQNLKLFRIRF